jgi:Lytic transglycolase/Putative peptidoglycan binding domain
VRSFESRPDRVAFWAVMLAVVAMIAGAASSRADSGGTGPGGTGSGRADGGDSCPKASLGKRHLRLGDCGGDVRTLNWVLKAKSYRVSLGKRFDRPTDSSVRRFQRRYDLRASGVVNGRTTRQLRRTMRHSRATWYGPGFFGNRTACGQRLRRTTVGVAHRGLPCGTRVVVGYHGRWVRTRVIDRGPYAKDRYRNDWDLTQRTARKLSFEGADRVRVAVLE